MNVYEITEPVRLTDSRGRLNPGTGLRQRAPGVGVRSLQAHSNRCFRNFPIEPWPVLDHARSRGPYRTDWNWGAGVGIAGGKRIGMNLGGGGPDGLRNGISHTGFTVNGRVHKIPTVLQWHFDPTNWMAPWTMSNDRMELTFTPFYDRYARTNLLVIRSTTQQCFGTFTGQVKTDEGTWLTIDGLVGWAEDVHNRW